jgi:hypothetical protein
LLKKLLFPKKKPVKCTGHTLLILKKNNCNPNLKEYKKLFWKVNPKNLRRFPISEVYAAYEMLVEKFDTYILSSSPWGNDTAASNKVRDGLKNT